MSLEVGRELGSFEVVGLLGKGGMGEVWRARDLRLDREVALKVLPPSVASDPERLQEPDQPPAFASPPAKAPTRAAT